MITEVESKARKELAAVTLEWRDQWDHYRTSGQELSFHYKKRIKMASPIYIVAEPRSGAVIMEAENKARKERTAVTLE